MKKYSLVMQLLYVFQIKLINKDNSCPGEGIFAIPSDCQRFYRCVKSTKGSLLGLLMKCPSGFHFYSTKCVKLNTEDKNRLCSRQVRLSANSTDLAMEIPRELYSELVQGY